MSKPDQPRKFRLDAERWFSVSYLARIVLVFATFHCITVIPMLWLHSQIFDAEQLSPDWEYVSHRLQTALFWGGIFGSSIHHAFLKWQKGNFSGARLNLIVGGGLSTLAQLLWEYFWFLLYGAFGPINPAPAEERAKFTLAYATTDLCLQAALLLTLVGFLLPCDPHNTVQVTEDLRL